LNDTPDYGLCYPRDTEFIVSAYKNAYWSRCADDRKSTSGGIFFLGCRLVAWLSKNTNSFILSIVEVEYIIYASCCTQVLWIKQTLKYIKVIYGDPISIMLKYK
jgi:hypothetical protein